MKYSGGLSEVQWRVRSTVDGYHQYSGGCNFGEFSNRSTPFTDIPLYIQENDDNEGPARDGTVQVMLVETGPLTALKDT